MQGDVINLPHILESLPILGLKKPMVSSGYESLLMELNKARQTAKILHSEVQNKNAAIKDESLKSVSAIIAGIPQARYLRQFNTLRGHREKITGIKWSQDSVKLLSACQDGFMIIWDTLSGLKLEAIPLDNSWVLLCAYSPSGRYVALAGLDNRCTVYRVNADQDKFMNTASADLELEDRRPRGRKTPRAHSAYVSACEFITDNEVLTASGDMSISLWDFVKDARVRDFLDHTGDVLLLLLLENGRLSPHTFLSSGADGCVKVWDVRTRGTCYSYQASTSDVECVSLFSHGYAFVAGCDSGECKLFDLRADCQVEEYILQEHFDRPAKSPRKSPAKSPSSPDSADRMWATFDTPGVTSLDVSSSGRMLYVCYADYGCIAWDLLKCDIVELIGMGKGSHTARISEVAVSPDGQGIATASWDSTIKVWST